MAQDCRSQEDTLKLNSHHIIKTTCLSSIQFNPVVSAAENKHRRLKISNNILDLIPSGQLFASHFSFYPKLFWGQTSFCMIDFKYLFWQLGGNIDLEVGKQQGISILKDAQEFQITIQADCVHTDFYVIFLEKSNFSPKKDWWGVFCWGKLQGSVYEWKTFHQITCYWLSLKPVNSLHALAWWLWVFRSEGLKRHWGNRARWISKHLGVMPSNFWHSEVQQKV